MISLKRNITPPIGIAAIGRCRTAEDYRYGFNGMESDDEVSVGDGSYDFGARMYDARLGRWWSVDPLVDDYPSFGSYSYAVNCPVHYIDPDGKRLRVAGDVKMALEDLRSMIPENFRSFLKVDSEGIIYWDIVQMEVENMELDCSDPGIHLLDDVMYDLDDEGSEKLHEYRVAETVTLGIAKESDGSRISSIVKADLSSGIGTYIPGKDDSYTRELRHRTNHQFVSLSSEPMREDLFGNNYTMYGGVPYYEAPLNQELTSQLVVAKSTHRLIRAGKVEELKPRPSLLFHELTELYLRGNGLSYREAHELAIKREIEIPETNEQGIRDVGSEGKGLIKNE